MPKKPVPLPPPAAATTKVLAESRSIVEIRLGSQRYALEVSSKATANPTPTAGCIVQTRYVRLRRPAVLNELIDGWRVCWIGGWDKGDVFFVVMVQRTVPR